MIAAVLKRTKTLPFSSPLTIEKAHKDIEYENIELENTQKNTPLLNHYDSPQPRKFLQEEIGFLRKESDNKQKINDNLINLLHGVTTKRDKTNFSCESLQIRITSEKANHINETISSNSVSIGLNKN